MPGGRMQNRFQMLIDVALQGDKKLQGLASKAKAAAIDIQGMSNTLKDTGINLEEAKIKITSWSKSLKGLKTQVDATNKAKVALLKAEKGIGKAAAAGEVRIGELERSYKKLTVSRKAGLSELKKSTAQNTKNKVALKELSATLKEAKANIEMYATSTSKSAINTKKLKQTQIELDKVQKQFNSAQGKAVESTERLATARRKLRGDTSKLETAERKAANFPKKHKANLEELVDSVKKVEIAFDKERQALNKLDKELSKGGKSLKTYNRSTKTWSVNQQRIIKLKGAATTATKALSAEITRATKAERQANKGHSKTISKLNNMEKATARAAKRFNEWHDQRIGHGHGLTLFRRSLGALRNQLLVIAFATRGLRIAFNKAFTASQQMESALRGLGSVASNTGAGMLAAKESAKQLAKSGLLSVSEAAAGLKNLLSAGFGLPQATKMMNTLTDSAAFNRQGTLALGEAIVGATQGIKNQNSIMVDNAGITKNLSVMYKEYATSIGTTMGKLGEGGKRQAIFNGLMKEGAIFAGDASKVLNTMVGTLAKYKVVVFNAAAAAGDILRPAMQELIKTFADGAKSMEDYFKDPERKTKLLRNLADAGKSLSTWIKRVTKVLLFLMKHKIPPLNK